MVGQTGFQLGFCDLKIFSTELGQCHFMTFPEYEWGTRHKGQIVGVFNQASSKPSVSRQLRQRPTTKMAIQLFWASVAISSCPSLFRAL